MARLLKACGVRFYWSLAQQYPPELIQAKVDEWQSEIETGPGMLVKMIQQGGLVVAASEAGMMRSDDEGDWLRRRYERAGKGPLR